MGNVINDTPIIRVGVVDDHVLIASALAEELNKFRGVRVTILANNGKELMNLLGKSDQLPDIILMDVNMEEMNGIEATKHVSWLFPDIKVVAFTAIDDDWAIIRMLNAGACEYLKKDINKQQMEKALHAVYRNEKYHADLFHLYARDLRKYSEKMKNLSFSEQEKRILQLLREGYDYTQIADLMCISVPTVYYHKSNLKEKLNTNRPLVMVLRAISLGVIK